jgi:hypothetical protein
VNGSVGGRRERENGEKARKAEKEGSEGTKNVASEERTVSAGEIETQ